MGNTLQEQGNLDEAIEAYKKAISIHPDYAEAHNGCNVLQEQGDLDEAIEAYKKHLKPDYAEAHNNMGVALQDQGNLEGAMEAYQKAISIKPDYAEAIYNDGVTLQMQGALDKANLAYNNAISIIPNFTRAHRNLSSINKYTPSNPHFIQVKKLYKNKGLDEGAVCNLNFALFKMYEDMGTLDKAFKHLHEGNALRKKILNYSIDIDKSFFSA